MCLKPACATRPSSPYECRDAKPGAYPVCIVRANGEAGVVGWLLLSPDRAAAIVNLDRSAISTPRRDEP